MRQSRGRIGQGVQGGRGSGGVQREARKGK